MARYRQTDPAQRRAGKRILRFLAVLLAFTLIARGTAAATLARVVLATPERGEIIDAISGTATVHASDRIHVYAPAGLRITEMRLDMGQPVQAGMPAAVFDIDALETAYIRETAALQRMEWDLQQLTPGALTPTETPQQTAQRNLDRARADYDQAQQSAQADIAAAQEVLAQLAEPEALRNHQRALDDYDRAVTQGEGEVAAARAGLSFTYQSYTPGTPLQLAYRNYTRARDDYAATRTQGEEAIAQAQAHYDGVRRGSASTVDRTALENAQRNAQRARDDYNALIRQNEYAQQTAQTALDSAFHTLQILQMAVSPDPAAIAAAIAEIERAQAAVTAAQAAAQTNRTAAARHVEDTQAALNQAQRGNQNATQNEREQAAAALENAQNQAAQNRQAAERRMEDAQSAFTQAYEQAHAAYQAAQARVAEATQAARRRVEDAAAAFSSDTQRAQAALQTTLAAAQQSQQAAARRIEDASLALTNARSQSTETAVQNQITYTTLQLDIAEKQARISTLRTLGYDNGIFYAPYGGTVSAVQATGETTAAPLFTLRDTYGGFHALLSLPRAQGERLAIGNLSEVTTGNAGLFFVPTTTGTVTALSDPCENDRITVTIALPAGQWQEGQRVEAQIILSRANHDLSIPLSAVRSDNMGYFILTVTQQNTIMGVQNIVTRVNVTLIASDRDRASVWGAIDRNSQIITGANKAVSVGDRIRVN